MPSTSLSHLELDGYLTGIAVTPRDRPLTPEKWIPALWDDQLHVPPKIRSRQIKEGDIEAVADLRTRGFKIRPQGFGDLAYTEAVMFGL